MAEDALLGFKFTEFEEDSKFDDAIEIVSQNLFKEIGNGRGETRETAPEPVAEMDPDEFQFMESFDMIL